jgi:AcrR family transcriptional regulator
MAVTESHAGTDPVDGRRLRRSRNRDTVVEALLALVDAGELDPTIARVAEAAGLSARSVFRYFDDVDDLVRAAIRRQQERLAPLVTRRVDPELDLSDRIHTFVSQRIDLLAAMGNVGRVARLRAPIQPLVAGELARIRSVMTDQIRAAFAPELDTAPDAHLLLAAIDVACSFEAYESLARDHGLGRDGTTATMATALHALLGASRRAR